ncbi:MAG: Hpt domain-containing protein, partial [Fretibacterium sp.]|nr:Hpt domain-containing protein [Fretibacterium sp.]
KRTLPPEKVQLPSEDVSAVTKAEGTGASAETEAELPQVEGLDWGFAELHLPSRELLAGALRDFHAAIVPHADKLDGFYNALPDAWDDYRVLVHGMKSSAATVGIVPLAGVAKMLEYAARDRDRETVSALHGPFLREWRSYLEKLKGVFGIGAAGEGTMDFDPNAVRELIKTIRSSAEDFDIDEADAAVERMGKFRLPPELMEGFQTLRTAINDVDTDAALRAADEILRGMENE